MAVEYRIVNGPYQIGGQMYRVDVDVAGRQDILGIDMPFTQIMVSQHPELVLRWFRKHIEFVFEMEAKRVQA